MLGFNELLNSELMVVIKQA